VEVAPDDQYPAQDLVSSILIQTALVFHDMAGFFGADSASAYEGCDAPEATRRLRPNERQFCTCREDRPLRPACDRSRPTSPV
jgi:hypothetical protein